MEQVWIQNFSQGTLKELDSKCKLVLSENLLFGRTAQKSDVVDSCWLCQQAVFANQPETLTPTLKRKTTHKPKEKFSVRFF